MLTLPPLLLLLDLYIGLNLAYEDGYCTVWRSNKRSSVYYVAKLHKP